MSSPRGAHAPDAQVLDPRDNVATALRALAGGESVRIGSAPAPGAGGAGGRAAASSREDLAVLEPIPLYHKVALRDIAAGEAVIKYGEAIGTALREVRPGQHVHVHNLAGRRAGGREAPEAPT